MPNDVLGFRDILAVADIAQGDEIAADFGPGQHGDIGLPVPGVGRLQGEPPGQNQTIKRREDKQSIPAQKERSKEQPPCRRRCGNGPGLGQIAVINRQHTPADQAELHEIHKRLCACPGHVSHEIQLLLVVLSVCHH
jgi:hypothetical protein